jgi:hypothetical protein
MNVIALAAGSFVLATLAYGCDASNTSVAGHADAGSQGGGSGTGGSGARTGTGGTRATVGGALGIGGTRVNAGGALGTGGATGALANVAAFCNLQGQVAAQLNCPGFTTQQAIVTPCVTTNNLPASCQAPLDAAAACLSQQPTSSFQCSTNSDGTTDVISGVCTTQGDALLNCAYAGTGTCSDLASCCAQLSATDQTSCQQIVAGADNPTCSTTLGLYRAYGLCI